MVTRDEAFAAVVEAMRVSAILDKAFDAASEHYSEARKAAADAATKLIEAKQALLDVLEEEAKAASTRFY